jgi:hypothetical protein
MSRTRTEELAPVPWTPEQKLQFLAFQFQSQDTHYRETFPNATFSVKHDFSYVFHYFPGSERIFRTRFNTLRML